MTLNLKPACDLAGAAIVTLAGAEYFIPALALRQSRIAVPGLLKLLPKLNAVQSRIAGGDVLGAGLIENSDVDLMIDIVAAALTRAYPDATRDDVLDLEISFAELVAALASIARQTGLFIASAVGEDRGETPTQAPPISTEPSPAIVNIPASPGPTL